MNIEKINKNNISDVIEFLKHLPSLKKVDEEILMSGICLYYDKKICACISYEKIKNYGIARYFVYKNNTKKDDIEKLITNISVDMILDGIEYILIVLNSEEQKQLFLSFDFDDISDKYIFDEENEILHNYYEKPIILVKKINM